MKRKNNSDSKVLLFLLALKNAANNGERINTADFCSKFRIGKQYATVAKNIGLISQKDTGVYVWTGVDDITFKTVKDLKKAVYTYSHDKKSKRVSHQTTLNLPDSRMDLIEKKLDLILNFLNILP